MGRHWSRRTEILGARFRGGSLSCDRPPVTLAWLRSQACLDVNAIGFQDVLSHPLQSGRAINFQRRAPARCPSGEDQIRIASRVIGVKVRHKSHFQVTWFECRDASVDGRALSATNYAWPEVYEIRTVVNNNGGRRAGLDRGWACRCRGVPPSSGLYVRSAFDSSVVEH
jgi:hypothetical protein